MRKFFVVVFLSTAALLSTANAQTETAAKPVAIGETAPDFTLVDHRGRKVTLSDSKGKNPVVLLFYRGYW